jgi:hypothetical protein
MFVQNHPVWDHLYNYCATVENGTPDPRQTVEVFILVTHFQRTETSAELELELSFPTPNVGPQSVFFGNWKWSPLISDRIARVTRRSDLSARKSLCFRLYDARKETLGVELLSALAARVHRKF